MNIREFQLLLYCARSQPNIESIKGIVNEGINWQYLQQLAEQHGVQPLLLQSLKSVCWDAVPETTRLQLNDFNRGNVQRNLSIAGELLRLLDPFQQNRIPIAAFKGVVLAESVYGDLALREFSDLDVIVHEADVNKAEDILIAYGYRAAFPNRDYRSAFLSYHGQYAFLHTQTAIWVDLHWRLSSKGVAFPIKAAEIWPKLVQVAIAGRMVPTLAPDDLALFLAAHGSKEGWRRLLWVCDFAELLRKYQDIDWAAVLDRAQRSHSSRALLLAVLLSSKLLDTPTPIQLLDLARNNPAVRALAAQAQRRMLRANNLEGELDEFINGLTTHDRLRHRLWPLVTLLTTRTTGDYRAMPLPKWLWGLYYLTRPFRLVGKLAGRMLYG